MRDLNGHTLLIDFHGVIADLTSAMIMRRNVKMTHDEATVWNHPIMRGLQEELRSPTLYPLMFPYDFAADAIRGLYDEGFRIAIATDSPYEAREYATNWLNHWRVPFDYYIESDNKWRLDGDILIDDSPRQISMWMRLGKGRPAILMDQPWNQEMRPLSRNLRRCTNWDEIIQHIRATVNRSN